MGQDEAEVQDDDIYKGFNWGHQNVDGFMLAFVDRVEDVLGEGYCGYILFVAFSIWNKDSTGT